MKNGVLTVLAVSVLSCLACVNAGAATFENCYLFRSEEFHPSPKPDRNGHRLTGLWDKYYDLEARDLPAAGQQVLKDIMMAAVRGNLDWDFYDAARKYVPSVRRVDWKEADNAVSFVLSYVSNSGFSPLVGYMAMCDFKNPSFPEIMEFLSSGRQELSSSRHAEFYGLQLADRYGFPYGNGLPGFIADNISDDYEFALWHAYMRINPYMIPVGSGENVRKVSSLLSECLGTSYPNGKYAEFRKLADRADYAGLKAFVGANRSKAISLYAEEVLLQHRMDSISGLPANVASRSDDMASLLSQCRDLQRRRAAFKGSEKAVASGCVAVDGIVDRITAKSAIMFTEKDYIRLEVRNLPYVDIVMHRDSLNGPVLGSAHINNDVGSCHFPDTLRYRIPDMDDGMFVLECSSDGYKSTLISVRSRLSIVRTVADDGHRFYVCDTYSGKPVEKADVCVISGKDTLECLNDYTLDRLTPLEVGCQEDDRRLRVKFSCKDESGFEKSSEISLWAYRRPSSATSEPSCRAMVFTDRAAFNPGDTLKYKVLGYRLEGGNPVGVMEAGSPVAVSFVASDGKTIAVDNLRLSDFGSAAGEVVLPQDLRNGVVSVNVASGEATIGYASVTVDDFVLPDFEIMFDSDSDMKFLGDSLTVRGRVKAYSGHNLTDAKASYRVFAFDDDGDNAVRNLELESDGSFAIPVFTKASDIYSGYYRVLVRVTDATGVSVERYHGFMLHSSLRMEASLLNPSQGRVSADRGPGEEYCPDYVVDGDTARFAVRISNYMDNPVRLPVSYEVASAGKVLQKGGTFSGETLSVDLTGCPSGVYDVSFSTSAEAGDSVRTALHRCRLYHIVEGDGLGFNARRAWRRVVSDDKVSMLYGSSEAPVWALAFVSDAARRVLDSRIVRLDNAGGLVRIDFDWPADWPDCVSMTVADVKDGRRNEFTADYQRSRYDDKMLPLSFSSFTDKSLPNSVCTLEIASGPEAECLVSVFDKASETVRGNRWSRVSSAKPHTRLSLYWSPFYGRGEEAVPFRLAGTKSSFNALPAVSYRAAKGVSYDSVVEEEVCDASEAGDAGNDGGVREDFARTLCFEPFARTGKDGKAVVSFSSRENLSTFVVSVFAHDKSMDNNELRNEMLVTLPLKVSVGKPLYSYEGDRMRLAVSVQNASSVPMDGALYCYVYNGDDYKESGPFMTFMRELSVGPDASASEGFMIDVGSDSGMLGFKVVYKAGPWSDGVFVTVPVKKAAQTLTEAHSMVMKPGMSEEEAVGRLRAEFTGTSPFGAEYHVKTMEDILADFVIDVSPSVSPDAISWSRVFFKALYAGRFESCRHADSSSVQNIAAQAIAGMKACRNADGGFGWLPGMSSSLMLTESILYRMILAAGSGFRDNDGYRDFGRILDKAMEYAGSTVSKACDEGEASSRMLADYLFVRSLAGAVSPWTGDVYAQDALMSNRKYRKAVMECLVSPDVTRGNVVAKFKRAYTIVSILACQDDAGRDRWMSSGDFRKLRNALCAELRSVADYAVRSADGTVSYPSAMVPCYDIMSSDAFIHTFAGRFFTELLSAAEKDRQLRKATGDELLDDVSGLRDGLMLRTMLQKESCRWTDDPYYIEAVVSLLDAPENIRGIKIVSMSKTYSKPFAEISPASNGMSVDVKCYRSLADGGWTEITDGSRLHVGEKVKAVYSVRNAMSRSFVRLAVPRPACLHPSVQLSGWTSGLGVSARKAVYPPYRNCYREVKSDRTLYWYDTFPEGVFEIEEILDVTHEGRFVSPAASIVCEYAPAYRANAAASEFTVCPLG